MLEAQQRFRFAVAVLLFQKSPQRETAMVPHDRGRAESNDATCLLKSPAKIDIVASLVVFGIEATDVFKRPPIERHVTTRNVLGDYVCEQNMAGPARRCRHTGLDPVLCRRGHVWPADSSVIAAQERAD